MTFRGGTCVSLFENNTDNIIIIIIIIRLKQLITIIKIIMGIIIHK